MDRVRKPNRDEVVLTANANEKSPIRKPPQKISGVGQEPVTKYFNTH